MARRPPVEGWFRSLADGNVEVFARTDGRKIRAHGPTSEMNELLDWFESKAGVSVEAPWRTRRGPQPIEGQLTLVMGEEGAQGDLEES